jgi:hypothetical protein
MRLAAIASALAIVLCVAEEKAQAQVNRYSYPHATLEASMKICFRADSAHIEA